VETHESKVVLRPNHPSPPSAQVERRDRPALPKLVRRIRKEEKGGKEDLCYERGFGRTNDVLMLGLQPSSVACCRPVFKHHYESGAALRRYGAPGGTWRGEREGNLDTSLRREKRSAETLVDP